MSIHIELIGPDRLTDYASVPMIYEVRSRLDVQEIDGGVGGFTLHEEPFKFPFAPYTKDYDSYSQGGPIDWPRRFDISNWGFWLAKVDGDIVGAAAVAWKTPSVDVLGDQPNVAILWDIRVNVDYQRRGIGKALLEAAAQWSAANACVLLKIETQNVNVDACRFYSAMGCFLGAIDRMAYRGSENFGDEVMLAWYLDLVSQRSV